VVAPDGWAPQTSGRVVFEQREDMMEDGFHRNPNLELMNKLIQQ
jgi:hypothetical protein